MTATRQLGLVSKPGMFVLGRQDTLQRGEGGKACCPYLFVLLPAILWARTAFSIPLQALSVSRADALREVSHTSLSDPPVAAFGLLREIQDPGHIVAVSGFS